jgi:hypothetical protein
MCTRCKVACHDETPCAVVHRSSGLSATRVSSIVLASPEEAAKCLAGIILNLLSHLSTGGFFLSIEIALFYSLPTQISRSNHPQLIDIAYKDCGQALSPPGHRACVVARRQKPHVSERRPAPCWGRTARRTDTPEPAEQIATKPLDGATIVRGLIIASASCCNRYGNWRITAVLRRAGCGDAKRLEQVRRREGLKVPQRRPRRCRLWLADGSSVGLRPERRKSPAHG